MSKFYITTPIYYANGSPHLGHAYTTIASDVIARYQRMQGNDVFFLTGTDEHGSKNADKAFEHKTTPQEFVDQISAEFQLLFDHLNISNDIFMRTTSDLHKQGVKKFIQTLKEKKVIYKDTYEGLYCIGCEKFITEKELVDGMCPDHKAVPKKIKEENYFFNLKKFLPELKEKIKSDELRVRPEKMKKEVLALLDQDVLDNFSISREGVDWGIRVPFDEKQTIYVWTEALQNYITALGYGSSDEAYVQKYWPADVHMIGKDIVKFHAIFWPALLMAAELDVPKQVFAHGHFTINGDKMSKTIGNVIDPHDLIKNFSTDAARYLIISQFPFGEDGDIKEEKFIEKYNADLANGIGNLFMRTLSMTERYIGSVPERSDDEAFGNIEEVWKKYHHHLENFETFEAAQLIMKFVAKTNEYAEKNKPWELAKNDEKKLQHVLYNMIEANRHIALMIRPFMPHTSKMMMAELGTTEMLEQRQLDSEKWGGIDAGTSITKPAPLFMRK